MRARWSFTVLCGIAAAVLKDQLTHGCGRMGSASVLCVCRASPRHIPYWLSGCCSAAAAAASRLLVDCCSHIPSHVRLPVSCCALLCSAQLAALTARRGRIDTTHYSNCGALSSSPHTILSTSFRVKRPVSHAVAPR